MALLPAPRLRVTTAAGIPVSGGKLKLYNANTVTLTTLYTDEGLSVPAANPVVAASDGFLPQFFAADGQVCDGDFLTSGDVIISGQSFVDAVFVGASSGTITRDFSTGGRLRIAGSAGIVSFEAGDPLGDDVGGKWRLGGYAGSQADTGSLDAASINTTGDVFTVNSKKLPGVVYVAATAAAAASTVDIALPNAPTGVREWDLDIWNVVNSANGNLQFLLSYDNGVSFKAGATDYWSLVLYHSNNTATSSSSTSPDALMTAAIGYRSTAALPGRMRLNIETPNSGTAATVIQGRIDGLDVTAAYPQAHVFSGYGVGGYGRATHIRIQKSAGTIAFTYRLIPQRGTGD